MIDRTGQDGRKIGIDAVTGSAIFVSEPGDEMLALCREKLGTGALA